MKRSLLVFFMMFSVLAFSQDGEEVNENCVLPADKKLDKLLEKGRDRKSDYKDRMKAYKDALELYENNAQIMWEIAKMTYLRAQANNTSMEIPLKYFHMVESVCPEFHIDLYYTLASIYYAEPNDCEALKYFQKFLDFPLEDESKLGRHYSENLANIEATIDEADFYCNFFKKPVPFDPVLVKNVSTPDKQEYLPMISHDNELLFFTREYDYKGLGDVVSSNIQEFTESKRESTDVDFDAGSKMPTPFNVGPKYGGATVSLNNKELYICACELQAQYWNCDIFRTTFEMATIDGKEVMKWTPLENLGPNINGPKTWEAQPSLSADGNTLYFASARPGGMGSVDLYYSTRQSDGSWSKAENLGAPVNTTGSDKAPFMHSDSRTLYFASECSTKSKERLGAGKFDIFFTKQDPETGQWSKPKNIGYPINSSGDEEGIIVSTDGTTAYFSSDGIANGSGTKEIYAFPLYKEARPDKVVLVKGKVNTEDIAAVKDAKLNVRYMDGEVVQQEIKIDDDGEYVAIANVSKAAEKSENVVLEIEKEGKAYESILITNKIAEKTFVKNEEIEIKDVKKGSTHTLNDIYFASNSSDIDEISKLVLDGFAAWLIKNQTVQIEIQGHTDDIGNDADNLALSNDRAYAVLEYLASKGIKTSRLKFKGYGESKPKLSNDSEVNRAKNRRTDFLILEADASQ